MGERGLHRAADAEDAVVALLGREALEGQGDGLVFLADKVVGSVERNFWSAPQKICINLTRQAERCSTGHAARKVRVSRDLPEAELAVAGGIDVPIGQWPQHILQPRPLEYEGRETGIRHGGGIRSSVRLRAVEVVQHTGSAEQIAASESDEVEFGMTRVVRRFDHVKIPPSPWGASAQGAWGSYTMR